MSLRSAHASLISRYAQNATAAAPVIPTPPPPESTQRYESLLRDDDEDEDYGCGKAKVAARAREARGLAEQYVQFMGFDPAQAAGRAQLEKTATFYARSDQLLECLRGLVSQFCT